MGKSSNFMGNCPASHDWLRVRMMIFKKHVCGLLCSACFSLFQVFALLQTKSWKGKLQGPSLGPSCENIGGFHSHGSTQSLDGLFHGKSQSIMDDGMGYRYDLGNLHWWVHLKIWIFIRLTSPPGRLFFSSRTPFWAPEETHALPSSSSSLSLAEDSERWITGES